MAYLTTYEEYLKMLENPKFIYYEDGYIMFKCFKVRYDVINSEVELTCNRFLQWVFRTFFQRFWNGDVYLKGENKNG